MKAYAVEKANAPPVEVDSSNDLVGNNVWTRYGDFMPVVKFLTGLS
jgi:hypothetical protein